MASLFVPWLWLLFLTMLVCAAGVDFFIKKPAQSFVVFTLIYALEHFAYGSGVFWGCLLNKCFANYKVVILRQIQDTA